MRIFFTFFLIFLAGGGLIAQPCTGGSIADHDVSNTSLVRVFYDNDAFAGTNRYYTHGIRAELIVGPSVHLVENQ